MLLLLLVLLLLLLLLPLLLQLSKLPIELLELMRLWLFEAVAEDQVTLGAVLELPLPVAVDLALLRPCTNR